MVDRTSDPFSGKTATGDRANLLRDVSSDPSKSFDQVRTQVDDLMESLDLPKLTRKVQDFGRDKPIALAIAALAVGLAAGLLMRKKELPAEF